ncbi:MAG: acylphosphatase [Fidelibacterota bacterium]
MSDNVSAKIRVTGRVQLVGYRWFTRQWADDFGLYGWVKNERDGSVSIQVEGNRSRIEQLVKELKMGPANARVETVDVQWGSFLNQFREFEIRY